MKSKLIIISIIVVLLAIPFVSACSSNTTPVETDKDAFSNDENGDTIKEIIDEDLLNKYLRTDYRGDISIDALWLKSELIDKNYDGSFPAADLDEYYMFDLSFTTHSGDLLDFDYNENVIISNTTQRITPAEVAYLSRDSHHLRLLLKFAKNDITWLDRDNPEAINLVIKNLRNIPERQFTW